MLARRVRFSPSSCAMRSSRATNWALRLSRLFCAAILLRCARASLRSSGVSSVRERLRGGPSLVGCGLDFAEEDDADGVRGWVEDSGDWEGEGRESEAGEDLSLRGIVGCCEDAKRIRGEKGG